MPYTLTRNAVFKSPNILILDSPIDLDFSRVSVIIKPLENNKKKKKRILGLGKGMLIIKDNFDDPIDELREYME